MVKQKIPMSNLTPGFLILRDYLRNFQLFILYFF
jgi:hypothetical protein